VSNILAIANKELRSYFNSPIAYAVIGFFAFAFGFMFWVFLRGFVAESMRMTMNQMGAGGTVNINQMMLRPLVMQISVIVLFMLPSHPNERGAWYSTTPGGKIAFPGRRDQV